MKKVGGAREGSGTGKNGYFRGIYCASTYELAWAIYHLDNKIPFRRAVTRFVYGTGQKYLPDFEYPDNHFIEIKGFVRNTQEHSQKIAAVEAAGATITVLFEKDLANCFEWAKKKYKYTQLQELYDEHKPKFWFKCAHCSNGFGSYYSPRRYCSNICAGKAARIRNKVKLNLHNLYMRTPETKRKMGASMKKCHEVNPRAWVNNGKVSVMIFLNELQTMATLGFVRGRKYGTPTETRTRFIEVKTR